MKRPGTRRRPERIRSRKVPFRGKWCAGCSTEVLALYLIEVVYVDGILHGVRLGVLPIDEVDVIPKAVEANASEKHRLGGFVDNRDLRPNMLRWLILV